MKTIFGMEKERFVFLHFGGVIMEKTALNKNYIVSDQDGNKAKYGWYRYYARFGIPIYDEDDVLERYNIFRTRILIRRVKDGKLYLYDLVTTKKETSKPLESLTVR